MDRLPVFKALGDNTRYAIYLELARSTSALSTADIAERLGLHPNTVRPHLERMRDAGLLDVEVDSRGSVGRPQHRYSLASDAPSLGLEPPTFPLLAGLLANVAAALSPQSEVVAEAGRVHGRHAGDQRADAPSCVAAVTEELADLGFDPASGQDGRTTTIAFTRCPYRELAEAQPGLVCGLHRGLVEGFVDATGGGEVVDFGSLVDRHPCRVQVGARSSVA